MPHGLFLGSSLATQDRVSPVLDESETIESVILPPVTSRLRGRSHAFNFNPVEMLYHKFYVPVRDMLVVQRNREWGPDVTQGHEGWTNNSFAFVKAHLRHGIVDVVGSLLGFAVIINSVSVYIPQELAHILSIHRLTLV